MTDPAALKARYDLGPGCDAAIAALREVVGKLLRSASAPP